MNHFDHRVLVPLGVLGLSLVACGSDADIAKVPSTDSGTQDAPAADAGHVVEAGSTLPDAGAPAAQWTHPIGDGTGYLFPEGPTIWGAADEIYVGGVTGTFYHSEDDGRTFTPTILDGPAPAVIWGNSLDDVIVNYDFGDTYRTRDHGRTWQSIAAPYSGDEGFLALWGAGTQLYLRPAGGPTVSSHDDGQTWTAWNLPSGTASDLISVWGQGADLFVGGPTTVFHSKDQGVTWVAEGPANAGQIWTDSTGRILAVAGPGATGSRLSVSEDDGATWTDRTPTGVSAFMGIPNASALWLLEVDGTVIRSEDGGRSFGVVAKGIVASPDYADAAWVTGRGSVIVLTGYGTTLLRWGPP